MPSVRSPHEWEAPAGGGDGGELPGRRGRLPEDSSHPQQVMVPSVRSPHECHVADGDGGVLPVGRGRLPVVVVARPVGVAAPAGDGAVGAQPARMAAGLPTVTAEYCPAGAVRLPEV